MTKVCSKCGKEWPDSYEFKFCGICGGNVLEKNSLEKESSFHVSMDGSAVNGGIHRTDSHNVDSHDIHTTTNNTTQHVTNFIQQVANDSKETFRNRRFEFRQYCEKIVQKGGILSEDGVILLEKKMFELGLDKTECEPIVSSVKRSKTRYSTELDPLAKLKLESAKRSIKANSPNLKQSLADLKAYDSRYDNEELHFYFNMLLSALADKECIARYETRQIDNYWMSFWAFLAYRKDGKNDSATEVLASLGSFDDMPMGNLILLDAVASIDDFLENEDNKRYQMSLLDKWGDDCSEYLTDFKKTLLDHLSGSIGNPDFYTKYFLNQSHGTVEFLTKRGRKGVYTGPLKNGRPEGKGRLVLDNGTSYEGDFHEGWRHGKGFQIQANGIRFEGSFKEDLACGAGIQYRPNGDTLEGIWENGISANKPNIYTWANGDRFECEGYDKGSHGRGTYYWADGRVEEQYWEHGAKSNKEIVLNKAGVLILRDCVKGSDYRTNPDGRRFYVCKYTVLFKGTTYELDKSYSCAEGLDIIDMGPAFAVCGETVYVFVLEKDENPRYGMYGYIYQLEGDPQNTSAWPIIINENTGWFPHFSPGPEENDVTFCYYSFATRTAYECYLSENWQEHRLRKMEPQEFKSMAQTFRDSFEGGL